VSKLGIIREADVLPDSYPDRWSTGGGVRAKRLSPEGNGIGLIVAELDAGGTLSWESDHGDEGIYVVSGEVEVDGRICPTGGAVIVESGVVATLTARQPSRLVHCSSADPEPPADGLYGPPQPDNHKVHVIGPRGWFDSGSHEDVHTIWFTDSTCPTCRIALFRVDHPGGRSGKVHSHSRDEIIFVLDGIVSLGPREQVPGTALNIPADTAYKNGYPVPTSFLNFRRDVAEQRSGRNGTVLIDGGLARGGRAVEDFR
jgi:quercetin dioxygenase-like cupin family protein